MKAHKKIKLHSVSPVIRVYKSSKWSETELFQNSNWNLHTFESHLLTNFYLTFLQPTDILQTDLQNWTTKPSTSLLQSTPSSQIMIVFWKKQKRLNLGLKLHAQNEKSRNFCSNRISAPSFLLKLYRLWSCSSIKKIPNSTSVRILSITN